ncbi:hypothetical protein ACFJZE_14650, partial [Enterococcus faecalis]
YTLLVLFHVQIVIRYVAGHSSWACFNRKEEIIPFFLLLAILICVLPVFFSRSKKLALTNWKQPIRKSILLKDYRTLLGKTRIRTQ